MILLILILLLLIWPVKEHMGEELKQDIYLDILIRVKEVLDELKIPFFLSSGTCLGYYRNGRFIHYDYDIDIGIFHENYTPKIIDKLTEKGLNLYRVWGTIDGGYELSFRLPETALGRRAKVDIFLHYKEKDKICWHSYITKIRKIRNRKYKFNKKISYCVPKFKVRQTNFMGTRVGVPDSTEDYLINHYGDNWKEEIKPKNMGGSYVYHSSPKSIIKLPQT